jgi:hypothetical protein
MNVCGVGWLLPACLPLALHDLVSALIYTERTSPWGDRSVAAFTARERGGENSDEKQEPLRKYCALEWTGRHSRIPLSSDIPDETIKWQAGMGLGSQTSSLRIPQMCVKEFPKRTQGALTAEVAVEPDRS